jgi:hypothetical protein
MTVPGSDDLLDGPRTPASPIGRRRRYQPVTATRRGAGLTIPEREMSATDRFFTDPTEDEDEGEGFDWTPRHERPF